MRPFVVTLQDGKRMLGIALSEDDIAQLRRGEWGTLDLGETGTGLWYTTEDGSREFRQPRNSQILLTLGDSYEEIGKTLGVQMPDVDSIKRDGS